MTVRAAKIEAVEPHGVRTPDEHLGNVALIPGLVNAHTHLDLSGAKGLIPPPDPDHFTDWLRGVIAFRRTRSDEQTHADIAAGLAECLRHGTTLIGDIASEGRSWDVLAAAGLRAVVYYELIGGTSELAPQRVVDSKRWTEAHPDTPSCVAALSPHAPYSAHPVLFAWANLKTSRTATHLAESVAECDYLRGTAGPMSEFLAPFGIPLPLVPIYPDRVLGWLDQPPHVLVVHGNHLRWQGGLRPNQTLCYCPRTHAAFGHPPHPFRRFLGRGARVCLGTDSLASNPDLDILAEARFVHELYPDLPGDVLLKMVTLNGAEALGWADECGSLEPGKSADVVAVPLPDAEGEPHELLFSPHGGERRTMWRGEWR